MPCSTIRVLWSKSMASWVQVIILPKSLLFFTVAAIHTFHVTVHTLLNIRLFSHSCEWVCRVYTVDVCLTQPERALLQMTWLYYLFLSFHQRRKNVRQISLSNLFPNWIEHNLIRFNLIYLRQDMHTTQRKGWGGGNSCTTWGRSQVRRCQQKKRAVTLLEELDEYCISTLHKCRPGWPTAGSPLLYDSCLTLGLLLQYAQLRQQKMAPRWLCHMNF